jgi:hypothetical protein
MPSFFLAALLAAAASSAHADREVGSKPGSRSVPLWSDGSAEVSTDETVDVKLGIPRASRAVRIVVAEHTAHLDFAREFPIIEI